MNALPSTGATDEVDQLLGAFFQAAKPHPWPALKVPLTPVEAPRPRGRSLTRGRLALAASVAILLGGQAWMLGSYQTDETPTSSSTRRRGDVARKAPKPGQSPVRNAPITDHLPSTSSSKKTR